MQKILIVGGTGFLGFHLAKKCLSKGWKVHSVSTKKPKKLRYLKKVKYIHFNIVNKKSIIRKLKFHYDHVINLGGYVNHNEKKKTYESHFLGCKNLVDFFLKKKIKSFIQIGSCVEYGHLKSPQKEKSKLEVNKIKSTYGKAKLLSTKYLLKKFQENRFPCVILRLYLVYGPYQDFNRFIPLVVKGCIEGNNFPTSNGSQLRNFLYVDDFCDVVLKSMQKKVPIGEIFNVGFGKSLKLKKVILLIRNIINRGKPEWGKIKLRKDEIYNLHPNLDKIRKYLKWEPKVDFNKGLNKTINYYKKIL